MSAAADEVLALVDAFGEALNARNADASMALLDDHPDLTIIPSEGVEAHRGPEAVREFLVAIYGGPRRYGWRWTDRWVSVAGDVAWFTAVGHEVVEEVDAARTIPYCLTGTAVSDGASWRIRLLHASEDPARGR